MKNIIEIVKANKGAIAKRGLIMVGAIAGLAVASKVLIKVNSVEEDAEPKTDWNEIINESEEDSDDDSE